MDEDLIKQVHTQTGAERDRNIEALEKHGNHVVNAAMDILGASDDQLVDVEAEASNKRNENKGKIEDIMRDVPPLVGSLSPLCSYCGCSGKLQKCSRCKKNLYCSRTCQSIQWVEHKKYCLRI